jgi:hypothetical protein
MTSFEYNRRFPFSHIYSSLAFQIQLFGFIFDAYLLGKAYLTLLSTVVTISTTCFNIKDNFALPTERIYVIRMILIMNSDWFPKQNYQLIVIMGT